MQDNDWGGDPRAPLTGAAPALRYEICGSIWISQEKMLINGLSKLFEGPLRREALGKSVKIRFWTFLLFQSRAPGECLPVLGLNFRRTVNQYFGLR